MAGYIYIRCNESYDKYNACKLGKTINIRERDGVYTTGEIKRGKFILVIEIDKYDSIEKILQNEFKNDNIYIDGGIEFYNKKIINELIPYLDYLGFNYKKLTDEEINQITIRDNNNIDNNINNIIDIIPNNQQIIVLNKIDEFYKINNIGKIIWSCGLGKTLLSILISKKLNSKKIIIGVPSIYLQKQFINEILKIYVKEENILCVGGDTKYSTTNIDKIKTFINNNAIEQKIIITTYTSCYLLVDNEIKFDFKIGDESHHLTGIENDETTGYLNFHKIEATKTLYMTATEKEVESKLKKNKYTMSDEIIFGKTIDEKSVNWAIKNKKITDFIIAIIANTEKEIDEIIKKIGIQIENKELFMSAFMSLKAMEKYNDLTHILICCNTTNNAELITEYINIILSKKIIQIDNKDIYNEALHSNKKININLSDEQNEINKFKKSKYGIISSVYIFGEGFDLPKLNGVVFAENMLSDIRIIQTALRPNRLEKNNLNKKSYILIPYMESDDIKNDNEAFNKVRMIIEKMRNIDETIEQKIIITNINKSIAIDDEKKIENNNTSINNNIIVLTKIMLRLIHSKAIGSKLSVEQDEYNYVKALNKQLNIQSPKEYNDMKDQHKHFIDNPEEYFKKNGVWNEWYDFMGVDTSKFIRSKDEWKLFCKKNNVLSLDDYNNLCKKYDDLPICPVYFYNGFTNIMNELNIFVRR